MVPSDEHRMTRAEYARHRGVSWHAVDRAVTSGRIRLELDDRIDVQKADAAWESSKDPRGGRRERGDAPPEVADSRRRFEAARAERAEIDLKVRKGELILAADAERDTFTVFRQLRDRILLVPRRLSALLVGKVAAEIEAALTAEIRQALTELSEEAKA